MKSKYYFEDKYIYGGDPSVKYLRRFDLGLENEIVCNTGKILNGLPTCIGLTLLAKRRVNMYEK